MTDTTTPSRSDRAEADWLDDLNPEQRQAATAGLHEASDGGPLLIIAGAGTGKTNTLAHRVAALLAAGAQAESLLLLTFSRRAADEMTRRVQGLLARAGVADGRLAGVQLPWSDTFHGVGARLLREFAPRIGLDPGFSILDREDAADLINLSRHEARLSSLPRRFPQKGTCLAIYSAVVNTCRPLDEVLETTFPWCREWEEALRGLFLAYVEAKQAQQVLDYDDLLLYWARMTEHAGLASELGERFVHVLVDEYQDTNLLQSAILRALKPDGRGLTVVGDDAQSIYAFRGATVRNILDFPDQFGGTATRVTLTRNYRSSPQILAASNGVIALAGEGFDKNLWSARPEGPPPALVSVHDDLGQAGHIVARTLARREAGMRLKSQAVLFRAAHHSARLEIELRRHNIPFVKFGGLRFLEAAHVKDLLAALRWAQNPRDRVAGFRAIQLLAGIGPKTASTVLDNLAAAPPGAALLAEQPVPAHCREAWAALCAHLETLASSAAPWPASFERLADWYVGQIERLYDAAAMREADIRQLAHLASTYRDATHFLTDMALDPPEASSGEAGVPLRDEDYLILSTIHSAKGQEWRAVTVLNVVDGCIPSDLATGNAAEIDEERRLLYVAMTRAREELDLMLPKRFYVTHQAGLGDRHVYASRSRFIPNAIRHHFQETAWPPAPEALRGSPASRQAAIDLAASMRAMWK
ncbi:MAG: ATP-dependent helicase [Rhodocyclaceae bacterium]|nr:ATP-dependent helicase [Rhodocyclaceae bacterium]